MPEAVITCMYCGTWNLCLIHHKVNAFKTPQARGCTHQVPAQHLWYVYLQPTVCQHRFDIVPWIRSEYSWSSAITCKMLSYYHARSPSWLHLCFYWYIIALHHRNLSPNQTPCSWKVKNIKNNRRRNKWHVCYSMRGGLLECRSDGLELCLTHKSAKP